MNEVAAVVKVVKDLSSLVPFVNTLLKQADDSAFDVWRQTPSNRLNQLLEKVNLILQDNPHLQSKLSENEKYSPLSGINKTLIEYTFAVDDNKLGILQNALINGAYGDYTLELREDLYQIVVQLQPLDVHILKYLVSICSNEEVFNEAYQTFENEKKTIREDMSLSLPVKEQKLINLSNQHKVYIEQLYFQAINQKFQGQPDTVIKRSLDRLQNCGLVYNLGLNTYGLFNPYSGFVPLTLAETFLNFIADPRNILKKS